MFILRRNSKVIQIGKIKIGGSHPIAIQSMTNRPAADFEGTIAQVKALQNAGCDIVRLAVPEMEDAKIFRELKNAGITIPLVADIHFDYRIALESVKWGADKIRINPGNIGDKTRVYEVASACKTNGLSIRIGVNSGSLDKKLLQKYGAPTPEALAESALIQAEMLENCGFSDIVISIKSSSVAGTVQAAEIVAENSDYPLHLGVTEAGDEYTGLVKNAAGIGAMLCRGIGDTIRVSLTADPVNEVKAGREILRVLGLYTKGSIDIVSCPTCGRTKIDLIQLQHEFKERTEDIDTHGKVIKVAIMGCVVNGPGEAREADFGIAGGDGYAMLFKAGKPFRRVEQGQIIDALIKETYAALNEVK